MSATSTRSKKKSNSKSKAREVKNLKSTENQQATIITGAGSGIGRACAEALMSQGHFVFALGRQLDSLENTLGEGALKGLALKCDLNSLVSINHCVDKISKTLNSKKLNLTSLINNAGLYIRDECNTATPDKWLETFQTNLFGPAELTRLVLPYLLSQKSGAIINISSTLGQRPVAGTSVYSASKAAQISWTETLALELAPKNIRVNAVAPGVVETPIHSFFKKSDLTSKKTRDQYAAAHPLGKLGSPEDVARAVLFLLASPWITGTTIQVDGGIHL